MEPGGLALLADIVLVVHFLFVLFVVGGQCLIVAGWLLKWRWVTRRWFRFAHLGAIGFVMLEAWIGMVCPLTDFEKYLRRSAGQEPYGESFVGYWLNRLLFYIAPEWVFIVAYTLFFALVALMWVVYPPAPRRAGSRTSH